MRQWAKLEILLLFVMIILPAVIGSPPQALGEAQLTPEGPYIDRVVFKVIRSRDVSLLALEKGEIDLITGFVDPKQVPRLEQNPNIAVAQTERLGFGHLSFNTAEFPGNISEFRQAVAYALDKNRISTEAWGGFSRPVDSPVPPVMGVWSYEDQFPEHYYDSNPAKAIELLERAGFVDMDGDGMREYRGDRFTLNVLGGAGSISGETVFGILKENMRAVGVNVETRFLEFNSLVNRLDEGDFSLAFFGYSIGEEPTHLLNFKCGDSSNLKLWRFCNPDLDLVLDKMESAETFEEAVKWCWDAQKILWKEQPIIIVYVNLQISAYRTDRFEGYLNAPGDGVGTIWTFTKVRPKAGVGSEFKVSISTPVQTNNILSTSSGFEVLASVYDQVTGIVREPFTKAYMSYLARNWTFRNGADGGVELTIQFYPNIKWHDGTPFTAEDVKFSYEFQRRIRAPFIFDKIQYIDRVEVKDPLTVTIHSTRSGFFELNRIQGAWLLPKHVWEQIPPGDALSYANEQPIGTGPFIFRQAVPGEFYVLDTFKDGIWVPRERGGNPPITATTTTISTQTESGTQTTATSGSVSSITQTGTENGPAPSMQTTALAVGAALGVIIFSGFLYTRRRRRAG